MEIEDFYDFVDFIHFDRFGGFLAIFKDTPCFFKEKQEFFFHLNDQTRL